jgi:hypothetical protein
MGQERRRAIVRETLENFLRPANSAVRHGRGPTQSPEAHRTLWHGQRMEASMNDQTTDEALSDAEQRRQVRGDAETFRLHVQFLRAHGLPRGEVTTLYAGGVFLSGVKRHE